MVYPVIQIKIMKRFLSILALCIAIFTIAYALSSTKAPTVIAEFTPGTAWTSPDNMKADDDVTASIDAINPKRIQATGFGFALGATDVVDSITARIDCGGSDLGSSPQTFYLVKAGTATGTDNGAWINWTTGVMATYTLSGGLWGTTWTAAEINASNFGVEFDLSSDDVYNYAVDYIQLTAYYHAASGVQRSATGGVGYSGGGGFIY